MSRAGRRLNRALRVTPPAYRERYGSEWRGDLEAAAELGISPLEVARGATRAAWRLRLQCWGRSLSGAEGGRRAAAAWAVAVPVLLVGLLMSGWLFLLVIPGSMVVALVLAHEGPRRVASVVMLCSALLWLVCTVVVWWLWGVGFDAVDANLPEPAVTKWFEPAFVVGFCAFVTFWVAFVVSVARRASDAGRVNAPVARD